MKTKGSAITRHIRGLGITVATMILELRAIPAFAMPADPDPKTPTAPVVPLQNASSGRAWIIPLIIGGAVVLVAALIRTVRLQRTREAIAGA
ncbi:MAG: hypothetical protein ACREV8_05475 [Gammaproteobacteria bacterium]